MGIKKPIDLYKLNPFLQCGHIDPTLGSELGMGRSTDALLEGDPE